MPRPGDIGVVHIPGGVGVLIRIGQWLNGDGFRDYEHAFIVTGDGQIVEAEPGGAVKRPLHYDPDSVLWLHCPDEYRAAVAAAAEGMVGTPYSFADYLALAATRLHVPGARMLRGYVRSTGHMICSQLVDEAARRGGWHLFADGRPAQDVTPGDLSGLALHQATVA